MLIFLYLENKLLDLALTQHWGVSIFGEEDGKLSLVQGVEYLWCVVEELHITLLAELSGRLCAGVSLSPAILLYTSEHHLNVDVAVVYFECCLAARFEYHLLNIHEEVVAIYIVTTRFESVDITLGKPIECLLDAW